MSDERPEKSLRWMVTMLMLAVTLLAWAIGAAAYANDLEGWRYAGSARGMISRGIVQFLWNAVVQIPNAVSVIGYIVTQRIGFVVLFVVAQAAVLLFGSWAARIGRQHAEEDRRHRRQPRERTPRK